MKDLHYQSKDWGSNVKLGVYNGVSVWHGFVEQCGKCSIHHHVYHANEIAAINSVLCIEYFNDDLHIINSVIIGHKQSVVIPSRSIHRFRVLESGAIMEVYWVDRHDAENNSDFDIIRHSL